MFLVLLYLLDLLCCLQDRQVVSAGRVLEGSGGRADIMLATRLPARGAGDRRQLQVIPAAPGFFRSLLLPTVMRSTTDCLTSHALCCSGLVWLLLLQVDQRMLTHLCLLLIACPLRRHSEAAEPILAFVALTSLPPLLALSLALLIGPILNRVGVQVNGEREDVVVLGDGASAYGTHVIGFGAGAAWHTVEE